MVNQYGRCLQKNVGSYVGYMDFRVQMPANYGTKGLPDDQKVQFPSDAATYCAATDKKCEYCKQTAFAAVIGGDINGSLTRFCYGEDDCVCIAFCEAPAWNTTVGRTVCNGVVVNKAYDSQNAHKADGDGDGDGRGVAGVVLEIIGGVAAVVALLVFAQWARKRRHSSSSSSSSGSDDTNEPEDGGENGGSGDPGAAAGSVAIAVPVSNPGLSLFGWQAMRSELIEREQLLLAGVEDFSNVRTGYLQLLDVDASAPPHEEEDSSAPVLLVPLAGASAPSFSPREVTALASAPSAPPSTRMLEEELL
ncbi:hypothetical protein BBJ28_00015068 [Nothophytophthora sp. Chile5]|nr:hypothetical protein BBJ28_00015068 [Nothophytophthora sp. Chile5]